uniref:Uncharacterized protein n=1 Tax=Rhizophora mucronata TaxID=61149 RepID=A0A2P2QKC5_RHIMU
MIIVPPYSEDITWCCFVFSSLLKWERGEKKIKRRVSSG